MEHQALPASGDALAGPRLSIVLAGGGYGGHIYPAMAVAEVLRARPEVEALAYIGSSRGPDAEIASRAGLAFYSVGCAELPRRLTWDLAGWSKEVGADLITSLGYLRRLRPDLVFGTGGFASGPPLLAALMCRIPFVTHDADSTLGLVTRVMAPFAAAVTLNSEETRAMIRSSPRIVMTGNPTRAGLAAITRADGARALGLEPERTTLLVLGGVSGSPPINRAVAGAARVLVEDLGLQLVHQTGPAHFEATRGELIASWPGREAVTDPPPESARGGVFITRGYLLAPYLDDTPSAMAASDLAVTRAGALSLAELAIYGVGAILVPFGASDGDHQGANARACVRAGAGILLEEATLTSERLVRAVRELLERPERLAELRTRARGTARPEAAREIADVLIELGRRRAGAREPRVRHGRQGHLGGRGARFSSGA